jgi:hypothetical protein
MLNWITRGQVELSALRSKAVEMSRNDSGEIGAVLLIGGAIIGVVLVVLFAAFLIVQGGNVIEKGNNCINGMTSGNNSTTCT